MFVKFKFELYSRGLTSDELITTNLTGMGSPEGSTDTLVLDNSAEGKGFYYLQNSLGNEVVLEKNKTLTLFTHFTVPMSEFISSGTTGLTNSDELYIKLYVDASLTAFKTQAS